tara:strand:- start:402 stop:2846 length:2445 start_codon:yes stop_codon:yes gene_type:complete
VATIVNCNIERLKGSTLLRSFWGKNLVLLEKNHPQLHRLVIETKIKDIGEVVPTPSGKPTLKLKDPDTPFVYDTKDPVGQLKRTLPMLTKDEKWYKTVCIFTGMGLGYVQQVILEMLPTIFRMIIIEPSIDLFILAMRHVDLSPLLSADKVHILAGDINWEEFDAIINDKSFETSFYLSDMTPLFEWRPELYSGAKNKAVAYATRSVSSMGVLSHFGERLFKNRLANLTQLKDANLLDDLSGAFKGKPAVVVSAGPSLGQSIPVIKSIREKVLMIAVDSAVIPLLTRGIVPDLVATLDFRNLNSEKLSPDLLGDAKFSLVANISSSVLTAKRLDLNHLFFSFQENDTQAWLMDTLGVKNKITPVNTVASMALNVAQMTGADPIVLVGYDFALTSKDTDHAKGAVFSWQWNKQKKYLEVPGTDGRPVRTLHFLLDFKYEAERIIKQSPRTYINATAAGAHIDGTVVTALDRVAETLSSSAVDAKGILERCAGLTAGKYIPALADAACEQLRIVDKTLKLAKSIAAQNERVKSFVKKNRNKQGKISHISKVPKPVQAARMKREQLYKRFEPYIPVEEVAAKHIEEASLIHKTRQVNTVFGQIEKETEVMGLAMEGHIRGLHAFKRHLGDLIAYWEKEARIMDRIRKKIVNPKEVTALAELYLKNQDAVKAKGLLEDWDTDSCDLLLGECHAALLDFDAAFTCWQRAGEASDRQKKIADKKCEQIGDYWIERGLSEKIILNTSLIRWIRLCSGLGCFQRQINEVWPVSEKRIKNFINSEQLGNAMALLSVWESTKKGTTEWDELNWLIASKENGQVS